MDIDTKAIRNETGLFCLIPRNDGVADVCVHHLCDEIDTLREALAGWQAQSAEQQELVDKLRAVVEPLDRLREAEGNSVEICCPNPEFDGPAQVIVVNADWGGEWWPRRFEGETVAECLKAAEEASDE